MFMTINPRWSSLAKRSRLGGCAVEVEISLVETLHKHESNKEGEDEIKDRRGGCLKQ